MLKELVVNVGEVVSDAVYSDGSFKVPSGTLAFAAGSSGWLKSNGKKIRSLEGTVFKRGKCVGTFWSSETQSGGYLYPQEIDVG